VPDGEQEAMRDLTRAREDAKLAETPARQRLGSIFELWREQKRSSYSLCSRLVLREPLTDDTRGERTVQGNISKLSGKGFGFIISAGPTSFFFHASRCEDFGALAVGDPVYFDVEPDSRGKADCAVNVQRVIEHG
jgi:cold shock CspA family protein